MKRTVAQQRGEEGEALARRYLEKRGLRFMAANWLCKLGEIDLVMEDADGTRVFVEVRTRAETTYGAGFETVAVHKQAKLLRAAQLYQQQENYWGPMRFDVVSIAVAADGEPHVEHIPHAFEA